MTPEQVGPYRIVSQLGRGGMAVVYLARQPALARSVALKELAPFLAGDPALAQRFIREARVAGSLSHPNVVTVFDFLEQDGVPYIAMEYLERGSLRPFVGRMSLTQVAGVLEGLLAALSHAEAMKIVHRDVKPENLLVTSDGGVKIADFGIAKAMQQVATEEMLTPAGATVGTPAYMAPEQAMAQEIGGWTDLYQTGVVAFELLTGNVPFRTEGSPVAVLMQHISDPVPPLPAGTNPALEDWVRRMMAKEPADRPADAREAWDAFEEIVLDIHGPLWRRDARLGEHEPTAEHPKPLTPARFSSWQNYTPEGGSTPPPPPPPPTPDSAFSSGYVDYVSTRDTVREGVSQPPEEAPAPAEEPEPRPDTPPPVEPSPPADEPAPPADTPPPVEPDPSPPTEPEPLPPVTSGFFDDVPDEPAPRQDTPPPPDQPASSHPAVTPPPAPRAEAPPPADGSPTVAPTRPVLDARPERRRSLALPLGVLALVVVAVIVVVVIVGGGDDTPTPTPTATRTATATSAQPPAGPFATGDAPDGIAIGAGAVWAVGSGDGTLTRIDPATGETTSVDVGENPDSVIVALDSVWVSVTGEDKVVRLSAGAQPEVQDSYDVGSKPEGMFASGRAVWVANSGDGTVSQIIEETGDVNSVSVGGQPVDLAIGAGAVWVADAASGNVARVDGGKGELVTKVKVGPNPRAVAIVGRDVWVATAGDGNVWRIAGDDNRTTGTIEVGGQPRDIATDGEQLFVTDREGDRVVTIDPGSNAITKRDTVQDGPLSVAPDANDLWVTRIDGDDVARIPR